MLYFSDFKGFRWRLSPPAPTLVAFVPRRLIAALAKQLSLVTVAPPFDPGIDEQHMFYPTRAQMDPGSI